MKLLSELLRSDVLDVDGTSIGPVDDVRLVQDGPYVEGFGAALRIEGLVVGSGGLAVRLGFHRHGMRGPALLKAIFGALEARARFVAWDHVADWDGATVRLRCRVADLPGLRDELA
jgi:hypothetical protein